MTPTDNGNTPTPTTARRRLRRSALRLLRDLAGSGALVAFVVYAPRLLGHAAVRVDLTIAVVLLAAFYASPWWQPYVGPRLRLWRRRLARRWRRK